MTNKEGGVYEVYDEYVHGGAMNMRGVRCHEIFNKKTTAAVEMNAGGGKGVRVVVLVRAW